MSDSWEDRRRAQEDMYFEEQNKKALARLKKREQEGGEGKPRLSPITGEAMVEETFMGVVIDRCPKSNGIWLDAGELEEILQASLADGKENQATWIEKFINGVTGK